MISLLQTADTAHGRLRRRLEGVAPEDHGQGDLAAGLSSPSSPATRAWIVAFCREGRYLASAASSTPWNRCHERGIGAPHVTLCPSGLTTGLPADLSVTTSAPWVFARLRTALPAVARSSPRFSNRPLVNGR